jgi:hypothetical protein
MRTGPKYHVPMTKTSLLESAAGHGGEQAHGLLIALDRYAATFDLMLTAWRDRSIYESVREAFDELAASQKAQAPEAGLAMLELAMAHNDVAAALMDRQLAQQQGTGESFNAGALALRQQQHAAAVNELRSYILRKIH